MDEIEKLEQAARDKEDEIVAAYRDSIHDASHILREEMNKVRQMRQIAKEMRSRV